MIEVRNLSKRYGDFQAVSDLSFEVGAGEIFGFLGVNGAGKTTTLRMLTGVLVPTSGRIVLGGFDLAEDPIKAKAILGFIPDRPYLYNRLTAREYLYFVGDLHQVAEGEIDGRIDEVLSSYGLLQWQDELIDGFSHGMKQRLAICGALLHRPKILIVDEPMVGLDAHGAKLLKQNLRAYADSGMAIILSTHSLHVAEEVADRMLIINHGQPVASGTLEDIRRQTGKQEDNLEDIFLELTWNDDVAEQGIA